MKKLDEYISKVATELSTKKTPVIIKENKKTKKKSTILKESASDGWDFEAQDNYDVDSLLNKLEDFIYELRNCRRGVTTGCETYEDLGKYMQELGDELISVGEDVKQLEDIEED